MYDIVNGGDVTYGVGLVFSSGTSASPGGVEQCLQAILVSPGLGRGGLSFVRRGAVAGEGVHRRSPALAPGLTA